MTSGLDFLLPQDADAERAMLGSCLMGGKATLAECRTILRAGAAEFAGEHRAMVWAALQDMDHAGQLSDDPPDSVQMKAVLERRGWWDKIGGYDFLAGLLTAVPTANNAARYAGIVHEKYLQRQLVAVSSRAIERVRAGTLDTASLLETAERDMLDLSKSRVADGPVSIGQIFADWFADDGSTSAGLRTGLLELDALLGGIQPSELTILAARPSMGKSALLFGLADQWAVVDGLPVLVFSLEMSARQVVARLISSRTGIAVRGVLRRDFTPAQQVSFDAALQKLECAPLQIDDRCEQTISDLRAKARVARARVPVAAILVDFLQLVKSDRRRDREDEELGVVAEGLKSMAKELCIPVVAAAQLNRKPEERVGKRPQMSDLRGSGVIEQAADVIALIGPDPDGDGKTSAKLYIDKDRNGETAKDGIRLAWKASEVRFANYMPGQHYTSPVRDNRLAVLT